jgi:hypothetical protein
MILALPVPYFEARGFGSATYTTAQIQQMIVDQANADGVPPSIALAVAQHESQLQPNAQNPNSSAAGLFQMLSTTGAAQGVTDPYDPTQDIPAGVGLLAKLYAQYGNWNTALEAYSEGQGAVAASGYTPSSQTTDLLSYVNSYSAPSGLDTSGGGSSFELSSLGLPSFSLPDLSQSTIFPGVPDWVTWLGAAGIVAVAIARS